MVNNLTWYQKGREEPATHCAWQECLVCFFLTICPHVKPPFMMEEASINKDVWDKIKPGPITFIPKKEEPETRYVYL
jgi:hypothetical protein